MSASDPDQHQAAQGVEFFYSVLHRFPVITSPSFEKSTVLPADEKENTRGPRIVITSRECGFLALSGGIVRLAFDFLPVSPKLARRSSWICPSGCFQGFQPALSAINLRSTDHATTVGGKQRFIQQARRERGRNSRVSAIFT
jgi:hypothetical protein